MSNIFRNKNFSVSENIIKFKTEDTTIKKIIDFYTEAPFPNYGNDDDKVSISHKGNNNYLAKSFKKLLDLTKIF